jgi:hypothetical protein
MSGGMFYTSMPRGNANVKRYRATDGERGQRDRDFEVREGA